MSGLFCFAFLYATFFSMQHYKGSCMFFVLCLKIMMLPLFRMRVADPTTPKKNGDKPNWGSRDLRW